MTITKNANEAGVFKYLKEKATEDCDVCPNCGKPSDSYNNTRWCEWGFFLTIWWAVDNHTCRSDIPLSLKHLNQCRKGCGTRWRSEPYPTHAEGLRLKRFIKKQFNNFKHTGGSYGAN